MEDDIEITETPEEIAEKTRLELKRLRVEARKNRKLKKKAAAIDKKKEIIRNEFIREMKYGQTTYERWEKDWIQMMEKLNHVDLKNEVEQVLGEFRSMLDSKETLIERLKNDLKTAQEYMQFAVQGHLEVINYLKKTFEIIMKSIKGFYEDESFKMLEMYRKDYNFHKSVDLCRQNFFENIIIGSNDLSVAAHDQLHKEFVSRSLACTTFNVEKLEDFRDESVNSMKRLFDQMRETVSFFRSTSATPPRIRRYMKWIRAQVTDEKEINQDNIDWDKLQSLQITLMRQRNKLELQSMVELENLQQEKELFRQYFATMRRIVEGELERDEKKTRMFSYGSHKTVEHLKRYELHGEHLLNLVSVCRKLETKAEKILPFAMYTPEQLETFQCSSIGGLSRLDLFWIRVNNVVKQNKELEEEKRVLTDENTRLQQILRQYFQQEKYEITIRKLQLCPLKPAAMIKQEASHMVKRKQLDPHAKYL